MALVSNYGHHAPPVVHAFEDAIAGLLEETLWHDRVVESACEPLFASIAADCGLLNEHELRKSCGGAESGSLVTLPACARRVAWLDLGALPCGEPTAPARTKATLACDLFKGS
ncbi:MAG: hypothetical protein AAGA54_12105 [Myxococcota bacterium]